MGRRKIGSRKEALKEEKKKIEYMLFDLLRVTETRRAQEDRGCL